MRVALGVVAAVLMLGACILSREGQNQNQGGGGAGAGEGGSGAQGGTNAGAGPVTGGGGVGGSPLVGGGGDGGLGGGGGSIVPGDWWDTDWKRRVRVTFDNSAQNETLDGFVVLVQLDGGTIDYAAVQDAGQDIRFVDADGLQVLPHEIEAWNEAGSSFVWARVPQIAAASSTDFVWLYHGNPGVTDAEDAAATWADERAVWHLSEIVVDEQTTGTHVDSTGNGNSGQQTGNDDIELAGSIARAQSFDGTDDHVVVNQAGLQISGQSATLLARAQLTATPMHAHVAGAGSDGHDLQLWRDSGTGGWSGRYRVNGGQEEVYTSSSALNQWATLAVVYDGAAVRLYVDGALVGTPNTATGNLTPMSSVLYIGDNPGLSPRQFAGYIDEVRLSDVARSAAWLAAEHLSLSGAFVTLSTEEAID